MNKADAIKHYGSPTLLAKALGITLQAIGQWRDDVPLLRQYQLERLTNGRLKADIPRLRLSEAQHSGCEARVNPYR